LNARLVTLHAKVYRDSDLGSDPARDGMAGFTIQTPNVRSMSLMAACFTFLSLSNARNIKPVAGVTIERWPELRLWVAKWLAAGARILAFSEDGFSRLAWAHRV
jgi:hypothetical protein